MNQRTKCQVIPYNSFDTLWIQTQPQCSCGEMFEKNRFCHEIEGELLSKLALAFLINSRDFCVRGCDLVDAIWCVREVPVFPKGILCFFFP